MSEPTPYGVTEFRGEFLHFNRAMDSPSGKTRSWLMYSNAELGTQLGIVFFRPQWRKYVFRPSLRFETLYDFKCLREIADFTEAKTKEWREGKHSQ